MIFIIIIAFIKIIVDTAQNTFGRLLLGALDCCSSGDCTTAPVNGDWESDDGIMMMVASFPILVSLISAIDIVTSCIPSPFNSKDWVLLDVKTAAALPDILIVAVLLSRLEIYA